MNPNNLCAGPRTLTRVTCVGSKAGVVASSLISYTVNLRSSPGSVI